MHQCLYENDIELMEDIRTSHLSGIEIIWKYSWWKLGQAGFCGYRHRFLKAQFATEIAKAKFGKVWHEYFGVIAQFRSEAAIDQSG